MAISARIPVPEPGELRPAAEQLVAAIAPPGREPAKTMAVLARQPDLLSPFLGWAAALALNGVLPKRDHELLALRVAWNCESEFEWVEHVDYARDAGLSDAEIEAIPNPIREGPWTEAERALGQSRCSPGLAQQQSGSPSGHEGDDSITHIELMFDYGG